MTENQILVSSDHHANWDALEKLFQIAKEKEIPFVINGDIIGDYNFEQLAGELNLKFPYEIQNEKLQKMLGEEIFEQYMLYSQIKQNGGDASFLLRQIPEYLQQETIAKIKGTISYIESQEFQNKIKNLNLEKKTEHIISNHKIQLKALYKLIVKFHAKDFAELIDKYKTKTYFLNGNHEPIYFQNLVKQFLKNKELLVDLNHTNGIQNANGITLAGISNVSALMPFLNQIFNSKELNKDFSHQRGIERPILFRNVTEENLINSKDHEKDFEWLKIMPKGKEEFDVFLTHGQVGIGAWRDTKQCNEMPTLHIAAMLSSLAKLTIDGHLHTTHQMKNPLNKETIRAVGNKAFLLTKNNDGEIQKELIEVDAEYDSRGKYNFSNHNLKELILNEVFNP